MPATDYQEPASSSSSSSSGFGFSILSRRRDQVHSMESPHESTGLETELGAFQTHVFERFQELASMDSDKLLTIAWIRKLLDAFVCCHEEFKAIVFNNKGVLSKPPMDRYMSDFFERSVKALDVCNAIRDGIEQIRQMQKQLEIVLYALDSQRSIGLGQFRRAKKAVDELFLGVLEDKDSGSTFAHRNRSFGRNNAHREQKSIGHCRSLSWSVSRTWSAARQLQAIGSNLVVPKANEIMASNGLNVAVFTMNYVLLFVMWALVAAIPCQDRGLQTHFVVTRFDWAVPILSLHERIVELSKKRDRKNACGLLKEICKIEECARHLNELIGLIPCEMDEKASQVKMFPLTEEIESQVKMWFGEVRTVHKAVEEGLDPLERQVREVFHRIVRSRTEGLDSSSRAHGHT